MDEKKITIEEKLMGLAKRYLTAGKKSVEQIFALADVIAEAHAEFGEVHLEDFYQRIRVEKDGPTSKKHHKIGKEKLRFVPYMDLLPNCWTTIYELAKLEKGKFQQLVDDKVLHPRATWPEMRAYVTKKKEDHKQKLPRVVVDLKNVAEGKRHHFAKKLKSLLDEFRVPLAKEQAATIDDFLQGATG